MHSVRPSKRRVRFVFHGGKVRHVSRMLVPSLIDSGAGVPLEEPHLSVAYQLLDVGVDTAIRRMPGSAVNWRGSRPRDGRIFGPGAVRS